MNPMNNHWQPLLPQNQEGEHKAPRSGSYLRGHGQQPQQVNQFSPLAPPDSHPVSSLPQQTKAKQWRISPTLRITRRIRRRHQHWQSRRSICLGILMAVTLLAVIGASSGTASAYSYYQSQLPRVQGLAHQQILQTTRIYDRNGVLLDNLYDQNGGGRRTYVPFKDIPKVMQDAMTSAEDPTFWTNAGVDPQGILRAAIEYAQYHQVLSGGSTLTQQLVKDLTGDNQVTLARKIPEAALAIGLTQQYPKWKILEWYLNVAPFGAFDLGIEAAAEDYFHLSPICNRDFYKGVFHCTPGIAQLDYDPATKKHDPYLALARASLLAGMPQDPPDYDPTQGPSHKQLALRRQEYVLQQMMRYGITVAGIGAITPTVIQKTEQMTAKMTFTPYTQNEKDPHFVQWVISQLEQELGTGDAALGTEILLNGGFNIRTTIDTNLEAYVERAVTRHLTQPELQLFPYPHYATLTDPAYNVNDAAVVVMNAKTGEVLAMDGSSNYNSKDPRIQGNFNVAAPPLNSAGVGGRPPGSSFKPIVYATAFEMGWYPGMVVPDFKTYIPKGPAADGASINGVGTGKSDQSASIYVPPDYGGIWNNRNTTIRVALANSFNVPAVKTLQFVGVDNALTTAERMGITTLNGQLAGCGDAHCLSMVLGSLSVPLIQMVDAYQTFADNGVHVPPQGVLDIWDNYGHHLYHFDPNRVHGSQVLSPQVAYMMTSVLADEHDRALEFENDHVLSFWDWDPTCTEKVWVPYPDCQFHQVAAKTGTTDSFKDNWTIGYTPQVVVGVWAGNANNATMGQDVVGITGAAPIWHSVIERVSGHCDVAQDQIPCGTINLNAMDLPPQTTFTQPSGIHIACVSPQNGLQAPGNTPGDCDWMLDGQDPMQPGIVQTDNGMQGKKDSGLGNGNGP
jgi:membrane peptidoglycan carboxypeptidase